ncbi:hypothetical protein QIS74_11123 [Colletotrichum tabaci]|uniref:Uncharacterized protein n=1 Tax=Colletotrichum tabaci TaxID=1209068 RepID=A0AAV9SXI5_9PEZI
MPISRICDQTGTAYLDRSRQDLGQPGSSSKKEDYSEESA